MFKLMRVVMGSVLALTLISTLFSAAAFAAPTGATPGDAMAISGTRATLSGNSSVWYGFVYAGDGSQIDIQLADQGVAGMAFTVWTPEQVRQMEAGNSVNPVGAGSPNPALMSDLSWSGNFNSAGAYYVQVTNTNGDESSYVLAIAGDGVSLLPVSDQAAPVAAAPKSSGTEAVPAPAPATADGANPERAMAITGGQSTLKPGQSLWYGFVYAGDTSQIDVLLNAQGQAGLAFGVWTPDGIKQMEGGQAVDPVGRGSPNPDIAGADLFWTGNFSTGATYYVQVQNTGASPLTFSLSAGGDGVSMLPVSNAAVAVAPAPSTAAVPAPAPATPDGSSPALALPTDGTYRPLGPNSEAWYSFKYAGDASQLDAYLFDGGAGNFGFSVWTPDQIQQLAAGQSVDPVGRGSPNVDARGDLSWSGNFNLPGVYFLRVENAGASPVTYAMNIRGSGLQ